MAASFPCCASSHRSCTRGTSGGKEEKGERRNRPPRHVNEFFEGRAGRRDDRQEAGIRGARKPRGRVVWQQRRKEAKSRDKRERAREKEEEEKKRKSEREEAAKSRETGSRLRSILQF